MAAGVPLDDADRGPWLHAIGAWLTEHAGHGAVVSCSALKRAYRDVLREHAPGAFFVHLHGDRETVRRRVAGRAGHFMPESLVESQYAALEPLGADERGVVLPLDAPVDDLVDAAARSIVD
jgi:gluconokinase